MYSTTRNYSTKSIAMKNILLINMAIKSLICNAKKSPEASHGSKSSSLKTIMKGLSGVKIFKISNFKNSEYSYN